MRDRKRRNCADGAGWISVCEAEERRRSRAASSDENKAHEDAGQPDVQVVLRRFRRKSGGDSWVDPPVPIPNTAVKHPYAESTWPETAREARALPVSTNKKASAFADASWRAW